MYAYTGACMKEHVNKEHSKPMSKLVFYAQSTSVVISGRSKKNYEFLKKNPKLKITLFVLKSNKSRKSVFFKTKAHEHLWISRK